MKTTLNKSKLSDANTITWLYKSALEPPNTNFNWLCYRKGVALTMAKTAFFDPEMEAQLFFW